MNNKVVLAYSGGLDTSYCVKYLTEEKGLDVYAITVNTGGFNDEQLKAIEERKKQSLQWMHSLIEESLKNSFFNNPDVKKDLKEIEKQIISEKILPTVAADILLKKFNN